MYSDKMTDPFIIPTLETDRLVLRPFHRDDLDPLAAIIADNDVIRYATYNGEAMTRSHAWNWLCLMIGHWYMRGFGLWAVEMKQTGEFIGRIGLQYLDWFDDVELVWMLKKSAWGVGYGTEGARAAIKYGFNTLELPRMTSIIHTVNEPSIRLANKLGMKFERQLERQNIQFLEFSLNREDMDQQI